MSLPRSLFQALCCLWLLLGAPLALAVENVVYFHNDALGSPVAATDGSGQLLWTEAYEPYGTRVLKPEGPNRLWYTGKPEEPELGLNYFGARWYEPGIGRFHGIDPVDFHEGNVQSFNRYAYANNNPYRYVDPNGESPLDIVFLAYDVGKLGVAIYTGQGVGAALLDVGASMAGVVSPVPGTGQAIKAAQGASKAGKVTKGAGKAASKPDDVIHVTKDGVALPPGPKHKIPDNYVQNPHRSGNYGEIVDGKFKERLRIDPPTPPGQKGPNYSHYHKNGKGTHYSPRTGDRDPGF